VSPGRRQATLGAWVLVVVAALAVITTRLEFSYDLGLFLPRAEGLDQRILVARAGDTPGARYLLVALPAGTIEPAGLRGRLASDPAIARVPVQDPTGGLPPDPAWRYRYLLADMDWSAAALGNALGERLAELGLAADPGFENLVRHDPTLQSARVLDALQVDAGGHGRTAAGRPVLVVETAAPPFDLDGQAAAIAAVRTALSGEGINPDTALISGAGVFGVGLRDTIHAEATWRSVAASLALALVLWLAYRRWAVLWLAAVPLVTGMGVGLAAVALAFGQAHGITLAFGFTLMGVAIDYPLHYFSHRRAGSSVGAMARVWPTLRLGAISTVLAYAALLLGGAEGIAQLGLFSAVGVATAAPVTRFVIPAMEGRSDTDEASATATPATRTRGRTGPGFGLPVAALVVAVLALVPTVTGPGGDQGFWNRDLAALSPVPPALLARDSELRQAVGAPSMRYQLALADADQARLLERLHALTTVLDEAVAAGEIPGYRSIAPLLPPSGLQLERQKAIPGAGALRVRLDAATQDLPFDSAAFDAFVADVTASSRLSPLGPADYTGTPFESMIAASLFRLRGVVPGDDWWVTLVDLPGDVNPESLPALVDGLPSGVTLVDYRAASEALVAGYQSRTWRVLGVVLAVIAVLLLWRVRPARAAWSLLCVLAALALAAAVLRWVAGPLDLYHMIGLLLVAGLGLDYALFLGRDEADVTDTRHAVATCAVSTGVAFAVLAASAIPALRSLGSAVVLGVVISFALAWLSSRRPVQP